jgi:hypothetical protein
MVRRTIVYSIRNCKILDNDDVLGIDKKFSLIPRRTEHKKWIWLTTYYCVRRPNDNLIYSKEEYLVEKIKGLTVTVS